MIQFGRDESGSVFDPRRKPPPNYFSRRVQAKILLLVFLFMGVLMLMSEARKPKHWQWMWQMDRGAVQPGGSPSSANGSAAGPDNAMPSAPSCAETIDTRPLSRDVQDESVSRSVATGVQPPEVFGPPSNWSPAPSLTTAQLDSWNFVLRSTEQNRPTATASQPVAPTTAPTADA